MLRKIISLTLSFSLFFQYRGLAQTLNLADYLSKTTTTFALDRFRPLHLRYFSYDNLDNSFQILLDKGDREDISESELKTEAKELIKYFQVGLALPNDTFWVNLRPDAPDNIIDPLLEKTDIGKIFLEADLQLKKDTASLTSPQTKEGKVYWDKLYKKAGELFGAENIAISTITRPWIVPGEIIIRESGDSGAASPAASAYVYKATLKVLLEEDYLNNQKTGNIKTEVYNFKDPRMKELNEYSARLIRESIIPKLTQEVNSSQRYARLRQVYYSLILSRWFKMRFQKTGGPGAGERESDYIKLINSRDLTNLSSKDSWDKSTYFSQYKDSFNKGEYNLKEPVYTPSGQSIRSYVSGGVSAVSSAITISGAKVKDDTVSSVVTAALKNNGKLLNVPMEELSALVASPLTLDEIKVKIKNLGVKYREDIEEGEKLGTLSYIYLSNLVGKTILKGAINNDREKWEEIEAWLLRMGRYESEINRFVAQLKLKNYLGEEDEVEFNGYLDKNDLISAVNKLSSITQNELHDFTLGFKFIRLSEEIHRFVLKGVIADETESALKNLEGVEIQDKHTSVSPLILTGDQKEEIKEKDGKINEEQSHVGSLLVNARLTWRDLADKLNKKLDKINSGMRTNDKVGTAKAIKEFYEELGVFLSKENIIGEPVPGISKEEINAKAEEWGRIENELRVIFEAVRDKMKKRIDADWGKLDLPGEFNALINKDEEKKTIGKLLKENKFSEAADEMCSLLRSRERTVDSTEDWMTIRKAVEGWGKIREELSFLSVASSGIVLEPVFTTAPGTKRGGLDFTDEMMKKATKIERMGSFAGLELALPLIPNAELIDLDNEFSQLQATIKAGIVPNGRRILEFIAACNQRNEFQERLSDIIAVSSGACRLEELQGKESSPELRRALLAPDMFYTR